MGAGGDAEDLFVLSWGVSRLWHREGGDQVWFLASGVRAGRGEHREST